MAHYKTFKIEEVKYNGANLARAIDLGIEVCGEGQVAFVPLDVFSEKSVKEGRFLKRWDNPNGNGLLFDCVDTPPNKMPDLPENDIHHKAPEDDVMTFRDERASYHTSAATGFQSDGYTPATYYPPPPPCPIVLNGQPVSLFVDGKEEFSGKFVEGSNDFSVGVCMGDDGELFFINFRSSSFADGDKFVFHNYNKKGS